jgi:hypothetical protein
MLTCPEDQVRRVSSAAARAGDRFVATASRELARDRRDDAQRRIGPRPGGGGRSDATTTSCAAKGQEHARTDDFPMFADDVIRLKPGRRQSR